MMTVNFLPTETWFRAIHKWPFLNDRISYRISQGSSHYLVGVVWKLEMSRYNLELPVRPPPSSDRPANQPSLKEKLEPRLMRRLWSLLHPKTPFQFAQSSTPPDLMYGLLCCVDGKLSRTALEWVDQQKQPSRRGKLPRCRPWLRSLLTDTT